MGPGATFANLVASSPSPPPSPGVRETQGAAWAEAGTTCDPKGSGEQAWPGAGGTPGPGGKSWAGDWNPPSAPRCVVSPSL